MRQHLQDVLFRQAATAVEQEKFDARVVRRLFANGSLVVRVLNFRPSLPDSVLPEA